MKINIFKTVDQLLMAIADHFITIAKSSIASRGEFNVVLSGGSSPKRLYEMLASPGFKQQVEWEKVNFFFGDERYVPATDPENNAGMARKALFDPLHIPASKIFSIDTSLSPEEAAKKYSSLISRHFGGQNARFDLILLGLGDNSHTASLFPYTPVLTDKSAAIQAVLLGQPPVYRITMTAPLINQARHIAFLVYGAAKADAVRHVLEDSIDTDKYPAQLIHPEKGDLRWYIDEAAASGLKNKKV